MPNGRTWIDHTTSDLEMLIAFFSASQAQLAQALRANATNPRLSEAIVRQVLTQFEEQSATIDRMTGRLPELEEMLQRNEHRSTELARLNARLDRYEQRLGTLEAERKEPCNNHC
jgi:chromosome segregation ATPase